MRLGIEHPLVQWYQLLIREQEEQVFQPGETVSELSCYV
jgi:hypothetical protein